MVSEKSSIGEISSKISCRPDLGDVLALGDPTLDGVVPRVVADQPVEAVGLQGEELGNLERFGDLCERDAAGVTRGGARGQEVSFDGFALMDGAGPPLNQPPGRRFAFEGRRKAQRYLNTRRATIPACATQARRCAR